MKAKKQRKTSTPMVDDRIKQREQQIAATLSEIVDTIEKYFTIAPFQWIEGREEEIGCKCFPSLPPTQFGRFYPWADNWICQLFPEAREAQQKMADRGELTDEPGELAFAAQRFGFLCGILVGSKSRGATRDELVKQCDGFAIPQLQWERRRISEEANKRGGSL